MEECFDATQFTSIEAPSRNGTFRSSTLILSPDNTITCAGQVSSFQAYMEGAVEYDLVVFQVWRSLTNCSYLLRGEHRVQNYSVSNDYLLDSALVTPPLDPIAVEPGDVLSIYVIQGEVMDYGIQEYPGGGNTVFEIAAAPEMVAQRLDFCSGGAVDIITGAPNVKARIEEGEL